MVTAVRGHPLTDPDDVRELAFQLVPSENGPRLRATAEAPGVAFDEAANQLSACLVSEPGGRELRIQIVDVEVDELGVALVSLAVPRALSVRDFDQFVRGDTTYRGRAYLVGADGSYAATGPVQLHGIKLSVFIGIAAAFLLLSAIAWMRRHSRDAPVAGIGPFFKGVIVGKSGDASLSLFQIALWTQITFYALVYVWWRTGNLITLTTEMLGLLGFATAGSVAARWISSTRTPGDEAGTTTTNDALRAAVETARRLRAKADSLRAGAEEARTAEAESKRELEADPASKDARNKYEKAIRAAAGQVAAQDMAGRLAEDAEDRLTKLRRKVRSPSLAHADD
jgi:hypothetical protein